MLGVGAVAISAVSKANGVQRESASDTGVYVCVHFLLKGSQQHSTPKTQQWRGLKALASKRPNKIRTHGRYKMSTCWQEWPLDKCTVYTSHMHSDRDDRATYKLGLNISASCVTRIQWMGSRRPRSRQGASLGESPWDGAVFTLPCFPRSK